jgi:hypothetical protein
MWENNFVQFFQNVLVVLMFIQLFDWLRGAVCIWDSVSGECVTLISLVWMIAQIGNNGKVNFFKVLQILFH